MAEAVQQLVDTLDLERLEENLYRGDSPKTGWQRVYGGQVIGQALVAASRTVEDRPAHSLHGYFLLAGDPSTPIIYEVDRIRDGGSFTTRRVIAIQHGRPIFSMSASFHKQETGLDHQNTMPDVPPPDKLPSENDLKAQFMHILPEPVRKYWERQRPIELRPVDVSRFLSNRPLDPVQHVWFRVTAPLPDDLAVHQCALAYASDMTLLDTALLAHGKSVFNPEIQAASLDHAMWFHRPFRFDRWMLYSQESPNAGASRGFARGFVYSEDGALIASTAQEGLIRLRDMESAQS